MNMRAFLSEQDAAVTIDWVVLTAACVAMGLGVVNVTGSAMAELSTTVRSELSNTDASRNYFDELMNLASFHDYSSFSSAFGSEWGNGGINSDGRNWAQDAYDTYAGMDPQTLQDRYAYHYDVAMNGDPLNSDLDAKSVDHIAIQETVLQERGIPLPEGNLSAAEVRALYTTE